MPERTPPENKITGLEADRAPKDQGCVSSELTNAQYERFDPWHGRGRGSEDDDGPVMGVSWDDARSYCAWLSERGGVRARLPSEAEWENACRAGSRTEYCFGDDESKLGEYAWFDANSGDRAHTVGTKRANAWGLYDLHGNVWEWCEDTYHVDCKGAPQDARAWTEGGEVRWPGAPSLRVYRGGSWSNPAVNCRSADRDWFDPSVRDPILGFRPATPRPSRVRERQAATSRRRTEPEPESRLLP
jgi:formylglycine-generating enzyme required for sulfatase activity